MKLFKIINESSTPYGIKELIIKATSDVDAINIAIDKIVEDGELDYLLCMEELEVVKNVLRKVLSVKEIQLNEKSSILLFTIDF